jgi:adenylate cyclase class IV
VGKTRIHLDAVEGLGSFLELEVVLDQKESVERGEKVAREIMARLGIEEADIWLREPTSISLNVLRIALVKHEPSPVW